MSWRVMSRLAAILFGAVVLCGALPGEMNGCDTDLSDEVDHRQYCSDRCAAVCGRVITCGLYVPPDDAPGDATPEELCQAECETDLLCANPQFCDEESNYDPYPYISTEEAQTCVDDWNELSCDYLNQTPNCGINFYECPIIETCGRDVLCDPPEWE